MTQPSEELVYEWETAQTGDESSPFVYEVTAEKIADYCRAVGYENPIYVSDAAARAVGYQGVFAPPTMLYTYAPQRRDELIRARGFVAPEESQQGPRSTPFVGSEVRFQGVLVQPEDVITSTTSVIDKFQRRGNRFITFLVVAHNQRGKKVAEYTYTCLWRTRSSAEKGSTSAGD